METLKTVKLNSYIRPGRNLAKLLNIQTAANNLFLYLNQKLEKHGLSINKLNVLQVLADNDSMSFNELKEKIAYKGCDLSRLVAALETQGFVKVSIDLADRRARIINITHAGFVVLRFVYDISSHQIESEKENLSLILQQLETCLHALGLEQLHASESDSLLSNSRF